MAVVSSIGSAIFLRKAFAVAIGSSLTGAMASVSNAVVNYGAIGLSTSLNVFAMRYSEMEQGISVLDPETMETVGTSKEAAIQGVTQTIQCRWLYLLPIFFTQPMLMAITNSVGLLPHR